MKIEQRIRKIAATKIRVKITNKSRSNGGFKVTIGADDDNSTRRTNRYVKTKKEALSLMLAQIRCQPVQFFIIEPSRKVVKNETV